MDIMTKDYARVGTISRINVKQLAKVNLVEFKKVDEETEDAFFLGSIDQFDALVKEDMIGIFP